MAAIICKKCGHENAHGALFCEQCYTLLTDTLPIDSRTTALSKSKMLTGPGGPANYRTLHIGKLGTQAIALYVETENEPLIVLLTKQAIVGRVIPGSELDVRVDLTPYNGGDKGVSRQHAVFKRTEAVITIEDMNSSNGTWVNGTRMQPYKPVVLASGDRVRLGQLAMEIYLP